MATSAIYRLLPIAGRDITEVTDAFPIVGRADWTFTLRTLRLGAGGSFQLIIEGSPDGSIEWEELHDFGTVNAAALSSDPSPWVQHLSIAGEHKYLRSNLAASVGDNIQELLGESRYLDPYNAAHQQQLTQRVRNYDDGLVRLVEAAEDAVLQYLEKDINGILQACVDAEGGGLARLDALDHIQAAIALQAEWLFQKEELGKSKDSGDIEALEAMGRYHPSVGDRLRAVSARAATTWRGR